MGRQMKRTVCFIWGIWIATLLCACTAQELAGASKEIPYEELDVYTVLSRREVLDLVYNAEYADSEYMIDVSFYETEEIIGYKWYWYDTANNPMYLTQRDYILDSEGKVFGIVRLGSDLYDSLGVYMRTEVYNEFVVDMVSGEIIEMRVYPEDGGWDYSEEYLEKFGETKYEEMKSSETKGSAYDSVQKYVVEMVPEVEYYEKHIKEYSQGEARLWMHVYEIVSLTINDTEKSYYPVYVGEEWDDHSVNWEWFYVSEDMTEIYWYDLLEDELRTIEAWRMSEQYRVLGE